MRKYLYLIIILSFSLSLFAQEPEPGSAQTDESPFSLGVDITNRYVWRGLNLGGNAPSIQPSLAFSFGNEKHALSIGTWGAYSMGGTQMFQEADLFLTYSYSEIVSVTLTDYFFPDDMGTSPKYFDYGKNTTGHLYEATLGLNGPERFPISLVFAMNFFGADARKINDDGSAGDIFMSKYIELGYAHSVKGVDVNYFIGAALDNPDEDRGEIGFYGNQSMGLINLGVSASKSIEVTEKFSIPISTSLIFNPDSERIFLVLGISL